MAARSRGKEEGTPLELPREAHKLATEAVTGTILLRDLPATTIKIFGALSINS